MQCQDVELIRNMLINKERELLLSDAQHRLFQSSQQQDAHETLLKYLISFTNLQKSTFSLN